MTHLVASVSRSSKGVALARCCPTFLESAWLWFSSERLRARLPPAAGDYYADPRNLVWNLLQATGLTGDKRLWPMEEQRVLDYDLGLTDLVRARAASSDSLLERGDFDAPWISRSY